MLKPPQAQELMGKLELNEEITPGSDKAEFIAKCYYELELRHSKRLKAQKNLSPIEPQFLLLPIAAKVFNILNLSVIFAATYFCSLSLN